jgi:Flp pilus assembly protein TadD
LARKAACEQFALQLKETASPAELGRVSATGIDAALACAEALTESGDYRGALEVLGSALDEYGDFTRLHTARGWALENLGPEHLAEAGEAYRAALAGDPSELWAKEGLANVSAGLGDDDEAVALWREVVAETGARAGDQPELLEIQGWSLYRLGHFTEAIDVFRRAVRELNGRVSVRFDLGLALLAIGDRVASVEAYVDGIERLTANPPASRIGPIRVALDDLETGFEVVPPDVVAVGRDIRARLLTELWRAEQGSTR